MTKAKDKEITYSKHGAYTAARRWQELREFPDEHIEAVYNAIIEDLTGEAGPGALNQMEWLLLDGVIFDLIVKKKIAAYAMKKKNIITKEGSLLPCLGSSFIAYDNSMRRKLEVLYGIGRVKNRHAKKVKDLLKIAES